MEIKEPANLQKVCRALGPLSHRKDGNGSIISAALGLRIFCYVNGVEACFEEIIAPEAIKLGVAWFKFSGGVGQKGFERVEISSLKAIRPDCIFYRIVYKNRLAKLIARNPSKAMYRFNRSVYPVVP